ncbi:MAG: FtsW/RodA/SpoVE family cell cycle protein [Tepidisphaeraceae bacterium]
MDVSIYRLRHRDVLALCVLALLLLGIVMVQSAGMNVSGQVRWSWTERGTRHVMFALVAILTFFVVGRIDYEALGRPTRSIWRAPVMWMLAAATFASLIVLFPHVGIEVNGARRWLPLGICQVQPSELAKWAVVLFLAWLLTQRPVDVNDFFRGFVPAVAPIAVICLLIVIQDFGTAALIAACALTMMLVGRVKWQHLAIIVPPAIGVAMWFVMHKEYRWRRMTAFIDPYAAPQSEGYHMIQSLLSFATGGVTGRGLGNGIQKLGYLPEDTTDFIFAVICEELGLFGALLTIALYLGILYVAWQSVRQNRDSFGRMLAFGIGSLVGLQAVINIAVATVSVPTKGLSLPLVSAGGSGLVITCGAMGLLYSIARFRHEPDSPVDPVEVASPIPTQVSTSAMSTTAIWDNLAVRG